MVNSTPNPIKEYYIAYFDILGYRAFFDEQPEKVPELLNAIHDVIQRTKNHIGIANQSPIMNGIGDINIHTKIFSDNILACMEASSGKLEQIRLMAFLQIVADIQRGFVNEYGLFVRGGILKGELSFNDDYVFGKGLIDVVNIEERVAIYPRIVIAADLIAYLQENPFYTQEDYTRVVGLVQRLENKETISPDEQAFLNEMYSKAFMLQILERAKAALTLQWPDGNWVLCYLNRTSADFLFGKAAKDSLLQMIQSVSPSDYQLASHPPQDFDTVLSLHKNRVEEKLKKYGKNVDIKTTEVKTAEIREHVLRKYIWAMAFHNLICDFYQKPEHKILTRCNCDTRFLKMTIEVLDDETGIQAN